MNYSHLLLSFFFLFSINVYSQLTNKDALEKAVPFNRDSVVFTPAAASDYLLHLIGREKFWRNENDSLRIALSRLTDHYQAPFDSIRKQLLSRSFDYRDFKQSIIVQADTLPLRWLDGSQFIVDTSRLKQDPVITRKTIVIRPREIDTPALNLPDTIPDIRAVVDSLFRSMTQLRDTVVERFIDYKYLESRKIQIHRVENKTLRPSLLPANSNKSVKFLADSSAVVISSFTPVLIAGEETPFYIVPGRNMPDSLRLAVETLLDYTYDRDSILLHFYDVRGRKTPFWLSTGKEDLYRYWVKNNSLDSITIWLGNPSKFDIRFILEDDVSVERMQVISSEHLMIINKQPERTLLPIRPLKEIPVLWNYGLVGSFSLNQNYLQNWARGGQSSLSGMVDLRGEAKYTNKETNVTWTNYQRLRYGSNRTKEQGYRTTADILEFGSQYNKRITEKLDFSAVFYGMSQVANGFKYPNDSVVVSKFLNPGTFTVGAGFEYKPMKQTLVNFSVLSYKNTFVLDTTNINQVTHGIARDKRARQEMGGQLVISNRTTIMDGLTINNNIRLFSNYIEKPQNVDVDWEMNINKQINWLFTIRLNLHLIYDDDIRFPVLDSENKPVLNPDGTPKRVARPQFNQFMGLTLSFRL